MISARRTIFLRAIGHSTVRRVEKLEDLKRLDLDTKVAFVMGKSVYKKNSSVASEENLKRHVP